MFLYCTFFTENKERCYYYIIITGSQQVQDFKGEQYQKGGIKWNWEIKPLDPL